MEGNIISFRVFFDNQGNLSTELSSLPQKEIKNLFKDKAIQSYLDTILRECHHRFDGLHEYLEKNLQAMKNE
jgi:hypothetical protein